MAVFCLSAGVFCGINAVGLCFYSLKNKFACDQFYIDRFFDNYNEVNKHEQS